MEKTKIDFNNLDLGFDEINPREKEHELIFKKVKINQLDENPENNRIYEYDKEADKFLKGDIQRNGILSPIVIVKSEIHAGRYMIVSGHRRTRVAKELGMFELEAREIIARTPEEKAFVRIMLITANSTQRDRKPSEKAREVQYLKLLMKDNGGVDNIAKWISNATKMSERNVYRYEKLAGQPKDIQEAVDKGEISVKQAIGEESTKKEKNTKVKCKKKVNVYERVCELCDLVNKLENALKNTKSTQLDEKTKEFLKKSFIALKRIIDEGAKNNE